MLPYRLYIRCSRDRIQTPASLQCHRASDFRVDPAAATGSSPGDQDYKFLLHDRHKTFSATLDETVESWGIHVLRSPVRMPTANAHCERLIGSIRRECLDYLIPLNTSHLRRTLREWVCHYNAGRPHRSLGPGIPDRVQQGPPVSKQAA